MRDAARDRADAASSDTAERPPLPLFDLAPQWERIRTEAISTFDRLGARGAFILGAELAQFERE